MIPGFFCRLLVGDPVPTGFLFSEYEYGISSYLLDVVEGSAADFLSVDSEVKSIEGKEDTGGTNISVSHVTDLTATHNGRHVTLHAGVNEDCTIAT